MEELGCTVVPMSWYPTQFSCMLLDTSVPFVFKKLPFVCRDITPIAVQARMHLLSSLFRRLQSSARDLVGFVDENRTKTCGNETMDERKRFLKKTLLAQKIEGKLKMVKYDILKESLRSWTENMYWCVRAIVYYGGHNFTLFNCTHSPTKPLFRYPSHPTIWFPE